MMIGILTLAFHLEGCTSLKQRRQRLAGLRDRFGKHPQIAVCEQPGDRPRHSCWEFVAIAQSRPQVEQLLSQIERFAAEELDARLIDTTREWL